jgi:hypothetical protein
MFRLLQDRGGGIVPPQCPVIRADKIITCSFGATNMANPYEFLRDWCREYVNPTMYDDEPTAKSLADRCLDAAKAAGLSAAGVIKAAGGNLKSYMLSELNSAADREVERLSSKND